MQRAFESGQAAETFGEMVAELGGPSDFVDRWRDRLPAAKVMVDIHADETGVVAAIDTRALGEAVVQLGGGRLKQDDRLDLAVGLSDIARIGQGGQGARRFCGSTPPAKRPRARSRVTCARPSLSEASVAPPPLIHERIG
jgi:thymidine phosphorylase